MEPHEPTFLSPAAAGESGPAPPAAGESAPPARGRRGLRSKETDLRKAREWALRQPRAISGQGGRAVTFRVAATIYFGWDLDEPEAMMILREWNVGCDRV
jgi:hypothetical protein